MATASETIATLERKATQLDNLKENESARGEAAATVISFGVAKIGVRVIQNLIPALSGIMPVVEILGGGYATMRGMDPRQKNRGAYLGAGLGLGGSIVDRVADFAIGTLEKVKSGMGKPK